MSEWTANATLAFDSAETGLPGPNHAGVLGRRAGSTDFDHSPAMRAAGDKGLVWTPERLDPFLCDPQALVPDTAMQQQPPTRPQERALLHDLLAATGPR